MRSGLLIDDSGEPWPVNSPHLARRLGYDDARLDLAHFAVARCGFVHLRPIEDGVRVALSPGAFSHVTLAGALQALNQLAPRRILLVTEAGAELFASIFAFIEHAEYLTSDPPLEIKVPRLAVPRGLHNLATAPFAMVRPIVDLWKRAHGIAADGEPYRTLADARLLQRAVLARQLSRSDRLICEHFGGALRIRQPCDSLSAIGRGLEEMYDREYGDWLAQGYASALASGRLQLVSIRAHVQVSEATTVNGRYDRFLMPWRGKSGERLVLGISIRRELSLVS